jgi:hypothetical protein
VLQDHKEDDDSNDNFVDCKEKMYQVEVGYGKRMRRVPVKKADNKEERGAKIKKMKRAMMEMMSATVPKNIQLKRIKGTVRKTTRCCGCGLDASSSHHCCIYRQKGVILVLSPQPGSSRWSWKHRVWCKDCYNKLE